MSQRFMAKQANNPVIMGVLLEWKADRKLYVNPSDNLNPKEPKDLQIIMEMLAGGIVILAENRLMEMEGEGKEALKDAIVGQVNVIKAMIAKHLPRLQGKLIDVIPGGAVSGMHG